MEACVQHSTFPKSPSLEDVDVKEGGPLSRVFLLEVDGGILAVQMFHKVPELMFTPCPYQEDVIKKSHPFFWWGAFPCFKGPLLQ